MEDRRTDSAERPVIVCRCQEVTLEEIIEAIAEGAVTVTGVKKRTKAGMGICQGKTCDRLIAEIISGQTGIPVGNLKPDTVRAPVRPLEIRSLIDR